MKTSFSITLVAVLMCQSVLAQYSPTDSFSFIGQGFDSRWTPGSFKIETDAFLGSNAVNTQMFSDVLFRSSFTPAAKDRFLDGTQQRTNIYGQLINLVEYKLSKKVGVYVKHKSVAAFSADKEMTTLLLWGNASYSGQNVTSEKLRLTQANTITIGASHKLAGNEKWLIKGWYGISLITSLSEIKATKAELYTAEGGDYLDVNLKNFSMSEQTSGLRGSGLDLGLEIDCQINEANKIGLKVLDFNFNMLFDNSYLYLDSTFRFQGFSYNFNKKELPIAKYIDSSYNGALENARSQKKYIMLPTRLQLVWNRVLDEKSNLSVGVQSVDLGNYGISGYLSYGYKFSNKLIVQSGFSYGNFTGLVWSESIEYRTNNGFSLYGNLKNVNAIVTPHLAKSYGINLGIAKVL
jgi:hypothetical protein